MKARTAAWILGASLLVYGPSLARAGDEKPPAPDNTETNREAGMTADDQGTSAADMEMTAKIRAALQKDDSLSTYAKNTKVITRNGMVTLKGPVRSQDEKAAIRKVAVEIAGEGNVKDQLTVAPPK
jgi:osmotically-inducible protein OsmY